jgi:hypothetical protein
MKIMNYFRLFFITGDVGNYTYVCGKCFRIYIIDLMIHT